MDISRTVEGEVLANLDAFQEGDESTCRVVMDSRELVFVCIGSIIQQGQKSITNTCSRIGMLDSLVAYRFESFSEVVDIEFFCHCFYF